MLRRVAILALLVFQSLWLNIVLPGHTRGVVTLGARSAEPSAHACCGVAATDRAADGARPDGSPCGGDDDNGNRARHCAVCSFAAKLSLPVTIDLTPAPLSLVAVVAVAPARAAVSLDRAPTYLGRAPPAIVPHA